MIGTHCDCKPKNTELVQEVKENMPAFDEIMTYRISLKSWEIVHAFSFYYPFNKAKCAYRI